MAKVILTPEISAQIAQALKNMEGRELEEGQNLNLTPEKKAGNPEPAWYVVYGTSVAAEIKVQLKDAAKR
jgi:hypothetical protein